MSVGMRNYKKTLIIQMTRGEAAELGILICACGHVVGEHRTWEDQPCAAKDCECGAYDEQPKLGKFLR